MGAASANSNPRPTEAYKLQRYQQWTGGDRPWSAEAHYDHRQQLRHFGLYRRVMRVIETHLNHGRLLDVGCGGGLFLVFAGVFASDHNSGLNSRYKVEGAGFDPREVELARRISGAPVRTLAELTKVGDNTFDTVTLLNTLEHVNKPMELLRELRRVLRSGGVMVIVVPNNELAFWKLRHNIGRRPTSLASDEHINHFRPKPLSSALMQSGFGQIEFLPASHEAPRGSMVRIPARQLIKHGAYRIADAFSLGY